MLTFVLDHWYQHGEASVEIEILKIGLLSAPLNEFYPAIYEKLRRREALLKIARRLGTMSWRERLLLPGRAVRMAILKLSSRNRSRVYGNP